jgi:voltage-gated potassium channel
LTGLNWVSKRENACDIGYRAQCSFTHRSPRQRCDLQFKPQRGSSSFDFTGLTITFLKQFGLGLWLTFPLILSLTPAITLVGQAVGTKDGWSRFDRFYWSFITATTVGYGDIRPGTRRSRIFAILIAFLGLTLTGIVIAVAVQAATVALKTAGR